VYVPPIVLPTPEELERRRKVVARILALRESMPPLGFDAAELIRELREGDESADA
jgi:hypothetical protein